MFVDVQTLLGAANYDGLTATTGLITFPVAQGQQSGDNCVVITDISYAQAVPSAAVTSGVVFLARPLGVPSAVKPILIPTAFQTIFLGCRIVVPFEPSMGNWLFRFGTAGKTVDGTLSVTWFYGKLDAAP